MAGGWGWSLSLDGRWSRCFLFFLLFFLFHYYYWNAVDWWGGGRRLEGWRKKKMVALFLVVVVVRSLCWFNPFFMCGSPVGNRARARNKKKRCRWFCMKASWIDFLAPVIDELLIGVENLMIHLVFHWFLLVTSLNTYWKSFCFESSNEKNAMLIELMINRMIEIMISFLLGRYRVVPGVPKKFHSVSLVFNFCWANRHKKTRYTQKKNPVNTELWMGGVGLPLTPWPLDLWVGGWEGHHPPPPTTPPPGGGLVSVISGADPVATWTFANNSPPIGQRLGPSRGDWSNEKKLFFFKWKTNFFFRPPEGAASSLRDPKFYRVFFYFFSRNFDRCYS